MILGATVGYVRGTALPYLTARGPTIAYLENNKKSRISVLAEKHFDGGGHHNAAGGASKEPIGVVMARLRGLLPEISAGILAAEQDEVE